MTSSEIATRRVSRRRSTRFAIGILALAPVAVVAACGSSDSADPQAQDSLDVSPVAAVTKAAESASAIGSAQFSLAIDVTSGSITGTVSATGAYDARAETAKATITLPSGALGAASSVVQGPIQLVAANQVAYAQVPGLAEDSWIEIDPTKAPLSDLASEAGADDASVLQDAQDPSELLAKVAKAVDNAEKVGAETVRGTSATHYRGTADLSSLAGDLGEDASKLGDVPDPTYDIWIDGKGRIAKFVLKASAPAGTVSQENTGGAFTITLEQWAFGEPVKVSVPAASDVVQLSDVLPGLAGLAGLAGTQGLGA